MKALIFNSGIGKRMGELTKNSPKSMIKLLNGETIFERQIRILSECGIKDFIITTGPFEEQLINITKQKAYKDLNFIFVHNDIYDKTNYIYSCYLAKEYLDDDFLTLHGDLVFSKKLILSILADKRESIGLINKNIPLPEKDFKGRVINERLKEVSINIFDSDCFTFQPLYKLSKKDMKIWVDSIVNFIENKRIWDVYAENAFNVVSEKMDINIMSYDGYYINEIDNIDDYNRVSRDIELIDYREQEILYGLNSLNEVISRNNITKPLVVLDSFLIGSWVENQIKKETTPIIFSDFKPNPIYNDVKTGVELFKKNDCDAIISIGGGSAIDTAKAIKLFLPLDDSREYINQDFVYSNYKHISIPTTAGTGSESTRYAVIYYNGVKQSLTNDSLIPDTAILEIKFLETLPVNQKKATIFDALCHSIESLWSINSTEESISYSQEAIKIILNNIDLYLKGDNNVLKDILKASNLAGKAINITQTTAAHAMSYKLTSLYGIPHGQAVAICLPSVWKYLIENRLNVNDKRGTSHTQKILSLLNSLFGNNTNEDSIAYFISLLNKYNMIPNITITDSDIDLLTKSVNTTRLSNFPIKLDEKVIKTMYKEIFGIK